MPNFLGFAVILAILAAASSTKIRCSYATENWKVVGRFYGCHGTIVFNDDPEALVEIKGKHREDKTNDDVKFIQVWGDKDLTVIPKGIEMYFPNLEVFEWSYGVLTTVTADDFKPFPNLLHISLSVNKIVTLEADLFQHTKKLQEIILDFNVLEHFGHYLLTDLKDLKVISLLGNICVHQLARGDEEIQELRDELPSKCPPKKSNDEL